MRLLQTGEILSGRHDGTSFPEIHVLRPDGTLMCSISSFHSAEVEMCDSATTQLRFEGETVLMTDGIVKYG